MKASMTTLVAVLTIGSVSVVASSASACHGGGFGYGGYSNSVEYTRNIYVEAPSVAPIFAPAHSLIVVLPGDSWFSISSREYGNSSVWSRIAEFNGMPQNLPLTVGMQLRLPVINPSGALSISSAPAMFAPGQGFAGGIPQGAPQGAPQGNLPQGFAQGGMPQGAQFGAQGGMPQGNSFAPQGQNFAAPQGFAPQQGQMGQPQGQPQGGQFGRQGGLPQGGQFGPQGQQFAPQNGMPQGGQFAHQGDMPQGGQFGGQPAAPQGPMNGPQGAAAEIAPPAAAAPQGDSMGQVVAKAAELAGQAIAGGAPNGLANGQPNGLAAPAPAAAGRPLPSIVIGSLMSIGGQQLGNDRGMVHLNINGQVRMLEVVEWTANAAKVKVPADLPAGIQAELEIIRADGSIVTKDQVQLAAGQNLAAGN